jgi:hypothetical protein
MSTGFENDLCHPVASHHVNESPLIYLRCRRGGPIRSELEGRKMKIRE